MWAEPGVESFRRASSRAESSSIRSRSISTGVVVAIALLLVEHCRVAHTDGAGPLDRTVDAEVDLLALAQAPVRLDLPERVEVADAGVGAACRRCTARYRPADADEGLAEGQQAPVPGVLLVR